MVALIAVAILLQASAPSGSAATNRSEPITIPDAPAAPISRETAERRLNEILAASTDDPASIAQLRDLADRVDDADTAALARYNAGVMAMRENPADAEVLFLDADRGTSDPSLQAAARYNLAHTIVQSADASSPPESLDNLADIDQRLADYKRAERTFRSTLEAEADHADAAKNTERLRQRIQALNDRRDQIQQRQQALEELADELEQLAREQQEQSEANATRSEQNESDPEQADQDAQQQQQSLSERTDEAAQQSRQADSPEQTRSELDRARRAQEQAERSLGEGDPDQAATSQQRAAEALSEAAEQARQAARDAAGEPGDRPDQEQGMQPAPSQAENPGETGQQPSPQNGGTEPAEQSQVDPIAEALIDKERREREERMRYLQRTGRQRVERDW
ncbi:MAG: hypothetical protein AAGA55_06450 [Planctomycetota bacterium]